MNTVEWYWPELLVLNRSLDTRRLISFQRNPSLPDCLIPLIGLLVSLYRITVVTWINSGNLDSDKGSLTILGRLKRLYRWTDFLFARTGLADSQTALAREFFGTSFPDVKELERNLDLIFVNSNEIIEMPRVLTTKIVYIGGVGNSNAGRVIKEWDNLLNLSSRGTILISFGTQVCLPVPWFILADFERFGNGRQFSSSITMPK